MICKTYQGITPKCAPGSYAAPNATMVGDVTMGEGASLWYGAVVRGDQHPIVIGPRTNIQDNAVLHVDPFQPMMLGEDVTVGHGAILHSCTVERGCVIGMGAILLNRCVIGEGSIVAAGAVVSQDTVIPPGSLVMGAPAKVRRATTPEEREHNLHSAAHYIEEAALQLDPIGE